MLLLCCQREGTLIGFVANLTEKASNHIHSNAKSSATTGQTGSVSYFWTPP